MYCNLQNPVVKEPTSSSNSSSEAPKRAFFTDASDTSSSATGSSSGAPTPAMPPFQFPSTPGDGTTPSAEGGWGWMQFFAGQLQQDSTLRERKPVVLPVLRDLEGRAAESDVDVRRAYFFNDCS